MIQVNHVDKSFGSLQVLKDVSLEVQTSQVVTIVGPSGAGKSTLLHLIGTLDRPDKGEIIIDDVKIHALSDDQLSDFRSAHIGFVFQFHHLLPEFTAIENVMLPMLIAGKAKHEAQQRAQELLGFLKLDDRVGHKPSELSGGEQQRVAVARALANNPDLILADEPSGNLDPSSIAARVALRASSTRSFFSFISTSEAAPTFNCATPPANLARRSCSFSLS